MYQIMESKLESILNLLVSLNLMEIVDDDDKLPNLLLLKNIELIRQIFIFYNTERHLPDDKKMRISDKCELIISKMLEKLPSNPVIDIPNLKITEDFTPKFTKYFILNPVIDEMKFKNIPINPDHLDDGKILGLFGEVLMKDSQVFVEADMPKVQKMYPIIRFMNAVRKSNAEKEKP